MIFGASSAGFAMQHGRRRALIIASIIGIAGCCMTQKFDFYIMNLGRLLFGFSTGQMVAVGAKFLEETIPPNLYEIFSPLIIAGNAIGTNFAFLLGLTLPD